MRTGWIVNLLLLLAVAGLGYYAWHRSQQPSETAHPLSTLTSTNVNKVEVLPRAGKPYTLERRDGIWYLASPMQARADQTQVQRVLDLLTATGKEKLAATDLQRFELDPPALTVTIDAQRFSFGTTNPLTQDQYIATGSNVYLVSTFYASLVPQDPQRLLTHTLFRPNETPVGFTFRNFSVTQKDGKWTIETAPANEKERPSQDDLNRWVDDWRYASSLLTQAYSEKPKGETISVRLADGKSVDLYVVQKEPELVVVRPDEKLQFRFSGEMSRTLLNPGRDAGTS